MITSVFIGSTQLDSPTRILTAVKNLSFPFIQYSATRKAGFGGQSVSPSNFASYKFAFEFTIGGTSFSDLASARETFTADLAQALSDNDQTLYINKENGVDLQIALKGVDITSDLDSRETISSVYRIELETEYPFLQSQILNTETGLVYAGGGMPIPMPIPMPMNSGGSNELTITQGGNAPAYPKFLFYGPLATPSLTNVTTGETLNLNYSLASGYNKILVDTFLRTVVIDPYLTPINGRQYASGDFWTLEPGVNVIHLGSSATGGKVEVMYRDHWYGL
jgi:hypothetical protein